METGSRYVKVTDSGQEIRSIAMGGSMEMGGERKIITAMYDSMETRK